MIKYTTFARCRDGDDAAAARRRWREEIAPQLLSLDGLSRCVVNDVDVAATNQGTVDGPAGFDSMTSLWFSEMAAFDAALGSPEWERATEGARQLFDPTWRDGDTGAEVEERVRRVGMGATRDGISTPPGAVIKLVGLLTYRPDVTREFANDYWRTTHGQFALRVGQMGHYVQNHTIRRPGATGAPGFDGYSEAWFDDLASYEAAMASDEWRALEADGPELFDMSTFCSAIVTEHVLLEHPPRTPTIRSPRRSGEGADEQ